MQQIVDAKVEVYCVETALTFCNLCFESYYDPDTIKTVAGFTTKGMEMDKYGYIIVDIIYRPDHETFCVILRDKRLNKLVVCFRGTSCDKHWSDNLNYKQKELDLSDLSELDEVDGLGINEGDQSNVHEVPFVSEYQHQQEAEFLKKQEEDLQGRVKNPSGEMDIDMNTDINTKLNLKKNYDVKGDPVFLGAMSDHSVNMNINQQQNNIEKLEKVSSLKEDHMNKQLPLDMEHPPPHDILPGSYPYLNPPNHNLRSTSFKSTTTVPRKNSNQSILSHSSVTSNDHTSKWKRVKSNINLCKFLYLRIPLFIYMYLHLYIHLNFI